MAYKVTAGDLRQRITIKKILYANNANGFPVEQTPTTICTVWAAARDMTVSKSFDAGTDTFRSITEFTIRHRTDIAEGMFVFLGSESYKITQVNQGSYGKEYLVLATTRMERVSG
jgi:SPP1 family predicted phage head-tail adaptor